MQTLINFLNSPIALVYIVLGGFYLILYHLGY